MYDSKHQYDMAKYFISREWLIGIYFYERLTIYEGLNKLLIPINISYFILSSSHGCQTCELYELRV